MSKIKCSITGASPLLMNRFTELAASKSSAGTSSAIRSDDKGLPRAQAEPKLYLMGNGRPMIPGPNIYRGIIDAGVFHKAGKKQITTAKSSLVPAGVLLEELEVPVENPFAGAFGSIGSDVEWEVDSRSVVNPATGGRMMCHRPRFDAWRLSFTLSVDDRMFAHDLVRTLVDDLGSKIGIGDFRPARKGPFGRFLVSNWQVLLEAKPETKSDKKKAA